MSLPHSDRHNPKGPVYIDSIHLCERGCLGYIGKINTNISSPSRWQCGTSLFWLDTLMRHTHGATFPWIGRRMAGQHVGRVVGRLEYQAGLIFGRRFDLSRLAIHGRWSPETESPGNSQWVCKPLGESGDSMGDESPDQSPDGRRWAANRRSGYGA